METDKKIAIEDAVAILKKMDDPIVIEQANKIADSLTTLQSAPQVTEFAVELQTFDKGLMEKYGTPIARAIEFGTLMYVALKLHFIAM